MKVYKCKVEFDNGSTIEDKNLIVFSSDIKKIPRICDTILCEHNDDSIEIKSIERIDFSIGDFGFVVEEIKL